MITLVFTLAARAELIDAQDWYEAELSGLGSRFRAEVDRLAQRISESTLQFPVVYRSVPRALIRQFPYALFFVVDGERSLTVIACFHSSRKPAQWQKPV